MKRWKPIKTEKKQLGGIIKLLQKVAPKLASKAKGRLLASHLGQIKDFKTPYIYFQDNSDGVLRKLVQYGIELIILILKLKENLKEDGMLKNMEHLKMDYGYQRRKILDL